jgi:hypothetical protein
MRKYQPTKSHKIVALVIGVAVLCVGVGLIENHYNNPLRYCVLIEHTTNSQNVPYNLYQCPNGVQKYQR